MTAQVFPAITVGPGGQYRGPDALAASSVISGAVLTDNSQGEYNQTGPASASWNAGLQRWDLIVPMLDVNGAAVNILGSFTPDPFTPTYGT